MSMPVRVWCLFIGSAIGFVIQIAQELARSPDVPADATWGSLAISSAVAACLLLACEHDACPPSRPSPAPREAAALASELRHGDAQTPASTATPSPVGEER
jgi:hypothetical protein